MIKTVLKIAIFLGLFCRLFLKRQFRSMDDFWSFWPYVRRISGTQRNVTAAAAVLELASSSGMMSHTSHLQ